MAETKGDEAQLAGVLLSMLPEGIAPVGDETDSETVRQRKKEILDASMRVFSQKGFDGGRTKEIAKEAGTSEATVFKYFPTKRHLMFALIKPLIETIARPLFMKPIERLLERQRGRPLEETLTFIMIDRWRMFADNERMIALAYMEAFKNPDLIEALKQMVVPQVLKYLEPLFAEAAAIGEIRSDLAPRFVARSFLSQVLGYIMLVRAAPETFAFGELESDIADFVSLFVRGLETRKGVPS